MLITRHLFKETIKTMVIMTGLIVLLFASNQFIHYLSRAADGRLPVAVILQLMALEAPSLTTLLLPLGLFLSLIAVLGRMNQDHELVVLRAMGLSQGRLLRSLLAWALLLSLAVLVMMCWLNPTIYHGRAALIRSQGLTTLIKTITPQHFRSVEGGNKVFYLSDIDSKTNQASGIFYAEHEQKHGAGSWKVLWAQRGSIVDGNAEAKLTLEQGNIYRVKAGDHQAEQLHFKRLIASLPVPKISFADDVRTLSTAALFAKASDHAERIAEFHWRIGVPIMVLVLSLCALPLSQGSTRQGRFARWIPAIILYTLYANGMFIGRDALASGKIPMWLGLWWLHLSVLIVGLLMLYKARWQ